MKKYKNKNPNSTNSLSNFIMFHMFKEFLLLNLISIYLKCSFHLFFQSLTLNLSKIVLARVYSIFMNMNSKLCNSHQFIPKIIKEEINLNVDS